MLPVPASSSSSFRIAIDLLMKEPGVARSIAKVSLLSAGSIICADQAGTNLRGSGEMALGNLIHEPRGTLHQRRTPEANHTHRAHRSKGCRTIFIAMLCPSVGYIASMPSATTIAACVPFASMIKRSKGVVIGDMKPEEFINTIRKGSPFRSHVAALQRAFGHCEGSIIVHASHRSSPPSVS